MILNINHFFALSNFPNLKFEGRTGERSYPQRGSYRNRYFLKLHVKADPPGIPHRVIPKIVIGDFTCYNEESEILKYLKNSQVFSRIFSSYELYPNPA